MKKLLLIPVLLLCGCATQTVTNPTTGVTTTIEVITPEALALIQTGATVATGAVLNFAVKQPSSRTQLANQIYASANWLYTATGGTLPTVSQFQTGLNSFSLGGVSGYASYTSSLTALYGVWYAKYVSGNASASDVSKVLNAIASGAEEAASTYATIPATTISS